MTGFINIHATKKLAAKLPLNENGLLKAKQAKAAGDSAGLSPTDISHHNPLNNWHANLLTLQRRNCVLFVHNETRFPVFVKGLLKPDFAELAWHFEDGLMNTLLKLDANQQQLDTAAKYLATLTFDTTCDRSVQGTMNRMAGDIDHIIYIDQLKIEEVSTYKLGAWLAERPCNIKSQKEWVFPKEAMLAKLGESTLPPSNLVPDNVIHIKRNKNI
ncbi:hypothetical protein [Reinekea sp. G2M2-21]|uniref:DUF6933 domain-containing protein n=1 Tax=Reinekea sp. G2M2-21 TaxID=2788942 RepID=UPI0018AAE414|nr:hypothetical protein [Reinekea sp. G2M2-21]